MRNQGRICDRAEFSLSHQGLRIDRTRMLPTVMVINHLWWTNGVKLCILIIKNFNDTTIPGIWSISHNKLILAVRMALTINICTLNPIHGIVME